MNSPDASATSPPAGLFRRLAAMCYDTLLVAAVLMSVTLLAMLPGGPDSLYPTPLWYPLILLASWFAFFGWFWTRSGATLGMRAWHLRLERDDGSRIDWGTAARRFLLAGLSLAPLGLGLLWLVFDPQGRALHDRWTGTRVVVVRPAR
ncbi:MAG: RDD family protein [Gammaproteobacteria bacterium]|nr:RDD family protein [Gammaproteobacteria bacterium]